MAQWRHATTLMSDLTSIFMQIIERCFFFASMSNDISRPMKDRPGFTTLQAWFKWPSSGSSCSLEQTFLNCHSMSMSFSLWSFSCGRRSSRVAESISMPKNVKHVIGPAVLWEARVYPIPYMYQTWLISYWSVDLSRWLLVLWNHPSNGQCRVYLVDAESILVHLLRP